MNYVYIFSQVKCGESVKWDDVVLPSKAFASIEALRLGIISHAEELANDYCDDDHDGEILIEEFRQASKKVVIDRNVGYIELYIDCMELIVHVQQCDLITG